MDFWALYGAIEPAPSPLTPPPACNGQVWVRNGWDSVVSIVMDGTTRVPYCWGVPQAEWPPENAILVAGPHAPWAAK